MDYFKHSHFYDKSCNNELLAMQQVPTDTIPSQLRKLVGLEYELVSELGTSTQSFVIRKQKRLNPEECQILAIFYVVGIGPAVGTVFPLPSVQKVLTSHLVTQWVS